jgi:hypothetical protein
MMLLITARGELKKNQASRSADSLREIANDIVKVADQLQIFLSDHHVAFIDLESQQGSLSRGCSPGWRKGVPGTSFTGIFS